MNAIVVVDKPSGLTSHDVIKQLRRVAGEPTLGHLGTLDPMATGVLPLLFGKFTRLAQFFSASTKEYEGSIRLGFSTDTYDAEGAATSPPMEHGTNLVEIQGAAQQFVGKISQVPPPYSAKKIGGVPAYKRARKGQPVDLNPVTVEVCEFKIHDLDGDLAWFSSSVSSGTYIRSLAHDLGRIIGCGAHLASLRRTRSGEFSLAQSVALCALREEPRGTNPQEIADVYRIRIIGHSIHPRKILPAMPCVTADAQTTGKLRHGHAVNLPEFSEAPLVKVFAGQSELVAIGARVAGTLFHPKVVML